MNMQRAWKAVQIRWLMFDFPIGYPCVLRLGDILDDQVEEKYFKDSSWNERAVPMKNPNLAFGLASMDGKVYEWGAVLRKDSLCSTLVVSDYKMPRMVYLG